MSLFCYCSLEDDTAVQSGQHARCCHAFLVFPFTPEVRLQVLLDRMLQQTFTPRPFFDTSISVYGIRADRIYCTVAVSADITVQVKDLFERVAQ